MPSLLERIPFVAYCSGMKIVMMGTGPFAVPTFESLVNDPQRRPVALITRPVPPSKGRRKGPENPMRDAAIRLEIPTFEPASINDPDAIEKLREFAADLFVVCDYGQILSSEALDCARLGGINLHGSLLPRYRGAAPINWALYHGEHVTGVSVIHMTPGLDAGPILAVSKLKIEPEDDAVSLEEKLSQIGTDAIYDGLNELEKWDQSGCEPTWRPGAVQDKNLITKAPRLKKQNGLLDWHRSATELANQVRAFKPWPGSYSYLPTSQGKKIRVGIDRLGPVTEEEQAALSENDSPGQIVLADKARLLVATGNGIVAVTHLQPAGKRMMEAAEFLRGHQLTVGDIMSATE